MTDLTQGGLYEPRVVRRDDAERMFLADGIVYRYEELKENPTGAGDELIRIYVPVPAQPADEDAVLPRGEHGDPEQGPGFDALRRVSAEHERRINEGVEITTIDARTGERSTELLYPHGIEWLRDRHRRIAELQAEETNLANAELFDLLQQDYAERIRRQEQAEGVPSGFGSAMTPKRGEWSVGHYVPDPSRPMSPTKLCPDDLYPHEMHDWIEDRTTYFCPGFV